MLINSNVSQTVKTKFRKTRWNKNVFLDMFQEILYRINIKVVEAYEQITPTTDLSLKCNHQAPWVRPA